jgi:hypothetical protein
MDEITIGDKTYISSKRAAQITGYAKDYVGQLCREGRVDARLVGRNWYVLESSIREHRFGKEGDTAAAAPVEEVTDRSATWQTPQYVPEEPVSVPELAPKADTTLVASPAIADMQAAWKEWFTDRKPGETVLEAEETPEEPIEEVQEAAEALVPEEVVTVTRIEEEVRVEAPVYVPAPQPTEEARPVELTRAPVRPSREAGTVVDLTRPARPVVSPRPTRAPYKGIGSTRALLVVLAVAAALVALVGTGHAEQLFAGTNLDYGLQKTILDYLGGTSTYESSL